MGAACLKSSFWEVEVGGSKVQGQPGVVMLTIDTNILEAEAGGPEFKASFVNIGNSRPEGYIIRPYLKMSKEKFKVILNSVVSLRPVGIHETLSQKEKCDRT